MNCWKQLVFFLWVCILDLCQSQEQFAGPFRIVVQQIGQCDDTGTHQIYMSSTRINKVSRTKYFYSTNVTTDVIIDDNLTELIPTVRRVEKYCPHFPMAETHGHKESCIGSGNDSGIPRMNGVQFFPTRN